MHCILLDATTYNVVQQFELSSLKIVSKKQSTQSDLTLSHRHSSLHSLLSMAWLLKIEEELLLTTNVILTLVKFQQH